METLRIAFTRGDAATQPGGVILRKKPDGELVTHRFNRLPHTRTPREFFWGHYYSPGNPGYEARAEQDFEERVAKLDSFLIEESVIIAKGDDGFDVSGNWEG